MSQPSPILLTGAAGGLGIHVLRRLQEQGRPVLAIDRVSPQKQRRHSLLHDDDHVEWMMGPFDDDQLLALVRRVDTVIHCAGLTETDQPDTDLFDAHFNFTRRLYRLATTAGVEHFIHISCASVYQATGGLRSESSPTEATNPFEEAKLRAEESLQKHRARHDEAPRLTVLRLALLYGPGCTTMGAGLVPIPALLRGVSRYLPGLAGGPRTNWCHVGDAAEAVLLVLNSPEARDQIYNVADETPLSFGEVVTSITEAYRIDLGPSVRIPSFALWALLGPLLDDEDAFGLLRALLKLLWRQVQKAHNLESPLEPRLNRDALFYASDDAIVLAEPLRSLGWSPKRTDFREGIAHTIRWYQEEGWVPRFDPDALVERKDAHPRATFTLDEHWVGSFDGPDGLASARLDLELTFKSWPLLRGAEAHLDGTLSIEGLAQEVPVSGTVDWLWWPTLRFHYQGGFQTGRGSFRVQGSRAIAPRRPINSFTQLDLELCDHLGQRLGPIKLHATSGPLALLAASSAS